MTLFENLTPTNRISQRLLEVTLKIFPFFLQDPSIPLTNQGTRQYLKQQQYEIGLGACCILNSENKYALTMNMPTASLSLSQPFQVNRM